MRNDHTAYKTGLAISDLQNHGLEIGMKVEIQEQLNSAGRNGKRKRSIQGEVMAINKRIFSLKTNDFRRIESFHLSDLVGDGKLELRVVR